MRTYFKRFDISITAANKTYSQEFELDKNLKIIRGFLITADQEDQLYYRGSIGIDINGNEFLPPEYEAKLLFAGVNVNPNERFFDAKRAEVLNGKIKIVFTDADNAAVSFSAYRVSIYVKAEEVLVP